MAKTSGKNPLSNRLIRRNLAILVGVAVIIFGLNQYNRLRMYETLATTPNQACRGINRAQSVGAGGPDLKASASVITSSKTGQIAQYKCLTDVVVQETEQHGKVIEGYELGAWVTYFESAEAAYKFAETELNPLRFWGVDEQGQNNGIPQTSSFTFLVTDTEPAYFDAYTVRDHIVFRISLSCDIDVAEEKRFGRSDLDICSESMEPIIKDFADSSERLFY